MHYSECNLKPENSKVPSGDVHPQTIIPDGRSVQQRAQQGEYVVACRRIKVFPGSIDL